jgi:tetratricopeptide (TPR) repeat protein
VVVGPWLLILDNMDNTSLAFHTEGDSDRSDNLRYILNCLPFGLDNIGRVIVTSINGKIGRNLAPGKPVEIKPLSHINATALLSAKIEDGFKSIKWDDTAASELVDALNCNPLAITQAAAYINWSERSSVPRYLALLDEDNKSVGTILNHDELKDLTRVGHNKPSAIFQTWRLSYLQISQDKPGAARLLSLMSILAKQEVPLVLLTEGDVITPPEEMDIQTLVDFSLIKAADDLNSYGMHRLVRLSTQDWLLSKTDDTEGFKSNLEGWMSKGVKLLARKFPVFGENEDRKLCKFLHPHALVVSQYSCEDTQSVAEVLYRIGCYEEDQGQYTDAYDHTMRAYTIFASVVGDTHRLALNSKFKVAQILHRRGSTERAKCLLEELLKERDNIPTRTQIAFILQDEGKYADAEVQWRKLIEIDEATFGKEHKEYLTSLHNLAYNLKLQEKYDEAEPIFWRVVSAREKLLGLDHPQLFMTMGLLATVLRGKGDLAKAEELHKKCVAGLERIYGRLHPSTLTGLANLARLLLDQNRFEEAEKLQREVLAGNLKLLGEDHAWSLISLHNLAFTLYEEDKLEEAIQLMQQASEGQLRVLGPDHPHTKASLESLETFRLKPLTAVSAEAFALFNQGLYEKAEELWREALDGFAILVGNDHAETLRSFHSIAVAMYMQNKYEEAIKLMQRAVDGWTKTFGSEDDRTKSSQKELECFRQTQEKIRSQAFHDDEN